jgi:hypothetical protein
MYRFGGRKAWYSSYVISSMSIEGYSSPKYGYEEFGVSQGGYDGTINLYESCLVVLMVFKGSNELLLWYMFALTPHMRT